MNITAALLALTVAVTAAVVTSGCSTTAKKEATVCTLAPPETSVETERDGLDREYIACIIDRDALGRARHCYESTFTEPGYTTDPIRVISRFQIEIDGHVTKSDSKADRGSDTLPKCINDTIKNLVFEKPFGAAPVKVTYPFLFKRVGG